jgi:hypothetical protein
VARTDPSGNDEDQKIENTRACASLVRRLASFSSTSWVDDVLDAVAEIAFRRGYGLRCGGKSKRSGCAGGAADGPVHSEAPCWK